MKKLNILLILVIVSLSAISQNQKEVFSDDFNDNSNKWLLMSSNDYAEAISDGKYTIQSKSANYGYKSERDIPFNDLENWTISVTTRLVSADRTSSQYGILWGSNRNDYFGIFIFANGRYGVYKDENNQRVLLIKWANSPNFRPGQFNEIKLEKRDNFINVYINGKYENKAAFEPFYGKRIGFFTGSSSSLEIEKISILQENFEKEEVTATKTADNKETVSAVQTVEPQKEQVKIENWYLPGTRPPSSFKLFDPKFDSPESIEPMEITMKPYFYKILRGIPKDAVYFQGFPEIKNLKDNVDNNPHYYTIMGDIYLRGWNQKEPNPKKAYKAYINGTENNDSAAWHRLAYITEDGEAQNPDPQAFLTNLTTSAQNGYPIAQYDLSIAYLNGLNGVTMDWRGADYWLRKAVSSEKDIVALNEIMTMLGRVFYHEEAQKYGISPSLSEARKWLAKAYAKEDLETLNQNLSSVAKLRGIAQKNPQCLDDINLNINYNNYDDVKSLIEQLKSHGEIFGEENIGNYEITLKENVLFVNLDKVKNNRHELLDYIQNINDEKWLMPVNKKYIDFACMQLMAITKYEDYAEAKENFDALMEYNFERYARMMTHVCVLQNYEKSKYNLTQIMGLLEDLFNNRWLRDAAKEHMPNIIYSFNELLQKSRKEEFETNKDLFKPKGEFETTQEYAQRQTKATEFAKNLETKYKKIKDDFNIQLVRFSFENIELSITNLDTYNADKQTFTATINNFEDIIKVPRDEAISFKENLKNVKISGDKQLNKEATEFEVFNIKLTHPVTGSVYYFGKQQTPLYLDFVASDDDAGGVPMLETSIEFIEPSGNNLLDAKEEGKINVTVTNKGTGTARMIDVSMRSSQSANINYDNKNIITGITPGNSQKITFNVKAEKEVQSSEIEFVISFTELKGFHPAPIMIKIGTQEFKEPKLIFVEAGIRENVGNGNNIIENSEIIDVSSLIQNIGQGVAKASKVKIKINDKNIICTSPNLIEQPLGDIQPGESRKINFSFVVNNEYSGTDVLPIDIILYEAEGLYGGTFPIGLEMKKMSLIATNIQITGQYASDREIKEVSLTSDVDKNIPEIEQKYTNRYALIIGNEDYTRFQPGLTTEANVDFARNDANTFAKYAEKTLGIPPENITLITDAISSRMNAEIEKLTKIALYSGGNAELFFYYAGHGFPDEKTNESYIMPVDISGAQVTSGIKLSTLYQKLASQEVKKVTVFLDACFSGGGREAGLLAVRGVKIKPKEEQIIGKLVIFSASSGEQSSLPYKEKQHGMFTYYLLKKLQGSQGKITYKELGDYIQKEVQLTSVKINNKDQNPQIIISKNILEEWASWKINE